MLERGNQGYEIDENEMKEMRAGYESHARLQREPTPQEGVAQASLRFEEVTSVRLCHMTPGWTRDSRACGCRP